MHIRVPTLLMKQNSKSGASETRIHSYNRTAEAAAEQEVTQLLGSLLLLLFWIWLLTMTTITTTTSLQYCDMTPESRNNEVRIHVDTFPRQRIRKQHSSNFRCYGKHAFLTIKGLCFLRGPCKVVIKKSSVEKGRVESRDAILTGYEHGSRGTELSRV
jgi:hypothetical protein